MISTTLPRGSSASVIRMFFRLIAGIASTTALAIVPAAHGQVKPPSLPQSVAPTVIVVGFVGGFVRNDDERHPEVQIVQRLSEREIYGLHVAAFENRRRGKAHKEVLHWLDTDGDGNLSAEEKQNSRIILFGHSWGGSAAIKLARDLNRRGIPVLMTIEVDSINKITGNDCLIPPNVAQAVNFYQTRGLVHGCRAIRAADPNRTQILGNYRFEYTAQPSACRSYSWANRHFLKMHEAIDCDPRVWSQVSKQIDALVESSIQVRQLQGDTELATTSDRP